jgi:hypothetical protein
LPGCPIHISDQGRWRRLKRRLIRKLVPSNKAIHERRYGFGSILTPSAAAFLRDLNLKKSYAVQRRRAAPRPAKPRLISVDDAGSGTAAIERKMAPPGEWDEPLNARISTGSHPDFRHRVDQRAAQTRPRLLQDRTPLLDFARGVTSLVRAKALAKVRALMR